MFLTYLPGYFRKAVGQNGGDAAAGGGSGGKPENVHVFQEYTYKKITPCDICSQILRGKLRDSGYHYLLNL